MKTALFKENNDVSSSFLNAEKVYVVDYNKPICEHEKIGILSFDEVKTRDFKKDVA